MHIYVTVMWDDERPDPENATWITYLSLEDGEAISTRQIEEKIWKAHQQNALGWAQELWSMVGVTPLPDTTWEHDPEAKKNGYLAYRVPIC